jgi:hypothetical protein
LRAALKAKPAGTTLSGIEAQSEKYGVGLPEFDAAQVGKRSYRPVARPEQAHAVQRAHLSTAAAALA